MRYWFSVISKCSTLICKIFNSFVAMNNNGILHLKAKEFSSEQAQNSELLIRFSGNRLSIAAIHQQDRKLKALYDAVLFQSLKETFDALYQQHVYLGYPYSKVKVSLETNHFSFIPSDLYSSATLSKYRNFIQSSRATFFTNHADSHLKINIIANVEEELVNIFTPYYADLAVYSQASSLLQQACLLPLNGKRLVLQFNSGTLEAAVFNGETLLFYNLFETLNVDEFHYHLLLLMKELDLRNDNTSVQVSGEIENYSELYRRLSNYFERIYFAESNQVFNYQELFKLVPAHQFMSLLSLLTCE